MMYALVDGEKRKAEKGLKGKCDGCGERLRPRCGEVVSHHWAHLPSSECPDAKRGKGEWHYGWQARFPRERVEVSVTHEGKRHRADVLFAEPGRLVLEFQSRPLPPSEALERQTFWRKLGYHFRWVLDGREALRRGRLRFWNKEWKSGGRIGRTFRWKSPPRRIADLAAPFLIDVGTGVFCVRKIYADSAPFGGWGTFHSIENIVNPYGRAR